MMIHGYCVATFPGYPDIDDYSIIGGVGGAFSSVDEARLWLQERGYKAYDREVAGTPLWTKSRKALEGNRYAAIFPIQSGEPSDD